MADHNYNDDGAYDDDYFWETDITTVDTGDIPLFVTMAISLLLLAILPWLVSSDIISRITLAVMPSLAWDDDDEDAALHDRAWKRLPRDAKKAARKLGYNGRLWDKDILPSPLENKDWKDLSREQRESAKLLGYDQIKWDGDESEEGHTQNDRGSSTDASERNDDAFDCNWDELTPKLQAAARNLGYNQRMWDNNKEPAVCKSKNWDQLSPNQRFSAIVLGYTRETWDEIEISLNRDGRSDRQDEGSVMSDSKVWLATDNVESSSDVEAARSDITEHTTNALATDVEPANSNATDVEAADASSANAEENAVSNNDGESDVATLAVTTTENVEDDVPTSIKANDVPTDAEAESSTSTASETSKAYSDLDWKVLPDEARKAAECLGYSESTWNSRVGPSWCTKLGWDDLTPVQAESAAILGYDKEKWDQKEEGKEARFSGDQSAMNDDAPLRDRTMTHDSVKVEIDEKSTDSGYVSAVSSMLNAVRSSTATIPTGTHQKPESDVTSDSNTQKDENTDKVSAAVTPNEDRENAPANKMQNEHSPNNPEDLQQVLIDALDEITRQTPENENNKGDDSDNDSRDILQELFDDTEEGEDAKESSFLTINSSPEAQPGESAIKQVSDSNLLLDPKTADPPGVRHISQYFERTTDDAVDEKASVGEGSSHGGDSSVVSSLYEYEEAVGRDPLQSRAYANPNGGSKVQMVIPKFLSHEEQQATDPISTLRTILHKYDDEDESISTLHTFTSAMTGVFAAAMQSGSRTRGPRRHARIRRNFKEQIRTEEIVRAADETDGVAFRDSATCIGNEMSDERSIGTLGAQSAPTTVGLGKSPGQALHGIPVDLRVKTVTDMDDDELMSFTSAMVATISRRVNEKKDIKDNDENEDFEKYKRDGCCRSPVWCRPRVLGRGVCKLINICKCDNEAKEIMKLGAPFLFMSIFGGFLSIGILALVGKRLGSADLAVFVVTESLLGITSGLIAGITETLMTICSHARGAGEKSLSGEYIQIAFVLWLIGYVPHCVFWSMYTEPMMRLFGFEEEIAQAAVSYVRIGFLGSVFSEAASCLHTVFYLEDHVMLSTVIETVDSLYYLIAVVVALVFFEPTLNGLQWIYNGVAFLFFLVALFIVLFSGWFQEYKAGLFKTIGLSNRKAVKVVIRTAIPLSVGYVLSYGEWEVLTFLSGLLGPAEVAVWGVLGWVWSVMEGISLAIGDSAEVRCAYWLGAGRPSMARYSVYKSMVMGMTSAILFSIAIYYLRHDIPAWVTDDPILRGMVEANLPLVALGNATMSFGSMAWTVVGSQGRYRLATTNVFIGNYLITLPAAVICVVIYNYSLEAMVATVVIGYMFSGTLNSVVLLNSDWKQLSKDVIAEAHQAAEASGSSKKKSGSDTTPTTRNDPLYQEVVRISNLASF